MNNRTLIVIVLSLTIIGALGYLLRDTQEVASPIILVDDPEADIEDNTDMTNRFSTIESQVAEISNQVSALAVLVKHNSQQAASSSQSSESYHDVDEIDEVPVDTNTITDPFSPEGIAIADEIQNRYISQVDEIYSVEEFDPDWAQSVESMVLPKLTDIANLSTNKESTDGKAPADITVANFECRSQMCSTAVITSTMEEMLAYQNHMIDQTKSELPSIVFGTIESYGNKFKMKAYLARDEYEFPSL